MSKQEERYTFIFEFDLDPNVIFCDPEAAPRTSMETSQALKKRIRKYLEPQASQLAGRYPRLHLEACHAQVRGNSCH